MAFILYNIMGLKLSKEMMADLTPTFTLGNMDKDVLVGAVVNVGKAFASEGAIREAKIKKTTAVKNMVELVIDTKDGRKVQAKVGFRGLCYTNVKGERKVGNKKEAVDQPLYEYAALMAGDAAPELADKYTVGDVVSATVNDTDIVRFPYYFYQKWEEAVKAAEDLAKAEDKEFEIGPLFQDRELMASLPGTDLTESMLVRQSSLGDDVFETRYATKRITFSI